MKIQIINMIKLQTNSLRPKKKKVFVSDIPTDPKNFRRLNEILFNFSEKNFIWVNFG